MEEHGGSKWSLGQWPQIRIAFISEKLIRIRRKKSEKLGNHPETDPH
jgi:hypothetical protein